MAFEGTKFKPGAPKGNALADSSATSGFVLQGVAVAGNIELGDIKEFRQLKDAEALGITKEYDTTNKVRVWYNIKEFYRKPENRGVKTFLMLVDNSLDGSNESAVTMEMMVDKDNPYAAKLITHAKGKLYQLTVGLNPATGYTSTLLEGMDADVYNAIPKALGLVNWSIDTNRPCTVLLEGREYSGVSASAADLRAIPNVEAEGVGVVIGQDWAYASTLDSIGQKHACIGTALGTMAAIRVNQNLGEVETQNLTDATTGDFEVPGVSSHQKCIDIEGDLETLNDKGYIYVDSYTDYDGVYFNDDHCAAPIVVDPITKVHNRHQLSLHRLYCKAARRLRTAMLPKVKSVQKIDSATGKLDIGVVKSFESLGNEEFKIMANQSEISEGQTYVNPDSNLTVPPRTLEVDFSMVIYGTIDRIDGNINLTDRL